MNRRSNASPAGWKPERLAWLTCILAFSAIGRAAQAPVSGASKPDTSTRAVVAAAAAYVAEYQRQLTSILADEAYSQAVTTQIPPDPKQPRSRRLTSEVFFMFVPGNHYWMAIRDVLAVDGTSVGERRNIRQALQTLPAEEVGAEFKTYNSRFNIGRTYRNFNEPTLSLLVFDANHRERFSFERRRIHDQDGTVLVTIAFLEKEAPTLITDLKRGRVFSQGEVVVEAGTGLVRHAVLEAGIKDTKLELATTYSSDARLGMWVPTLFREQYEHGRPPSMRVLDPTTEYELIVCEARYKNYRRFETSVRVK